MRSPLEDICVRGPVSDDECTVCIILILALLVSQKIVKALPTRRRHVLLTAGESDDTCKVCTLMAIIRIAMLLFEKYVALRQCLAKLSNTGQYRKQGTLDLTGESAVKHV